MPTPTQNLIYFPPPSELLLRYGYTLMINWKQYQIRSVKQILRKYIQYTYILQRSGKIKNNYILFNCSERLNM